MPVIVHGRFGEGPQLRFGVHGEFLVAKPSHDGPKRDRIELAAAASGLRALEEAIDRFDAFAECAAGEPAERRAQSARAALRASMMARLPPVGT